MSLDLLETEGCNSATSNLSSLKTREICDIINYEDSRIYEAIQKCIPVISAAIDMLAPKISAGGRLIYLGAGTSGRLGVLDASEIPPTFSAPHGQFVALMAGGDKAIRFAQEGVEDEFDGAVAELEALGLDPKLDSVIGIASSGRTPYVVGALTYAKKMGLSTLGVSCVSGSEMEKVGIDYSIAAVVGPEVLTGSTRLKAGTATKMVLNMISTGVMIRIGKTYDNLMVDLQATNFKLKLRSRRILRMICGSTIYPVLASGQISMTPVFLDDCEASNDVLDQLLAACGGSLKIAILVGTTGKSVEDSKLYLEETGGVLSRALSKIETDTESDSASNSTAITDSASETEEQASGAIEPLCLALDGGGTKCAVSIASPSGILGRGYAGPCNILSVGLEKVLYQVEQATLMAVSQLPSKYYPQVGMFPKFEKVWGGFAGVDRDSETLALKTGLERLFSDCVSPEALTISSDIHLLSFQADSHQDVKTAIALIVGTGSIACSYKRNDDDSISYLARSHGWGHVLGDEGSAYDIGRRALRHTLDAIDKLQIANAYGRSSSLDSLSLAVLKYFDTLNSPLQLLSKVFPVEDSSAGSDYKNNVSKLASLVTSLAFDKRDNAAILLLEGCSHDLVNSILRLVDNVVLPPSSSSLILTGGLMKFEPYRQLIIKQLAKQGIRFKYIDIIESVSDSVVNYLASKVKKGVTSELV